MTIISLYTRDQELFTNERPRVASGNENSVVIAVDFDSKWDGYAKSAVFHTAKDSTVYEVVMSGNQCTVPKEVIAEAGFFFIGVRGVNGEGTVKQSMLVRYRVKEGSTGMMVYEPSPGVYQQLLTALGVERARIDNLARLTDGSTTGDAELILARTDFEGKTHTNLQEAINTHTKKLTRGRSGLATLLPSSINDYPTISTKDKTFTIGGDTLIINDRLPMGYVSLHKNNGNDTVTWGDEITSSAICFYYDIANNKLVALNYNNRVDDYNYILLATLRVGHGTTDGKSWAVCSSPIYVDGKLSTEVNSFGGFAALLPPMNDPTCYPKFSTNDNTVVFAQDTLIVDPRLPSNHVSLQAARLNNRVSFGDITTSAICVYYGIAEETLVAKPYNEKVNTFDYLLVCTVRRARTQYEIPMAWASCPVWIDDRLSTDTKTKNVCGITTVKSVNHRGYTDAPENTLSAFRLSKKKGFTHVECDVSFTKDGYAVLLHDSTVDRTSNGTGNIADMTLEAVRALDFGSWKSKEYAGEQIPRFEEFIALCKHLGLHPYIELKEGTEAQIKALVGVVNRYGMKGKVTWISFVADFLVWVKSVDPKARLGLVVSTVSASTINTIKQKLQSGYNDVFVDCAYENATTSSVQYCVDADIPLEVWTVNSKNAILALDPYVSGVTSDNMIANEIFYDNNIGG